jgi:hypothetical protein
VPVTTSRRSAADTLPPQAACPRGACNVDSSRPGEIDQQVKRLMEAGEALYEIDRDLICELR